MMGNKIKEAIENRGFSISEVAHNLGISTSNLYIIFKKDHMDTKYLEAFSELLDVPMSYFFNNYNEPIKNSKSIDKGKFGGEVEEELRSQINKLEEDKRFFQNLVNQLSGSLEKIAAELGKEAGAETKRLFLLPKAA